MKYSVETIKKLLDFIEKEKSVKYEVCQEMNMDAHEVLSLISYIRSRGVNIVENVTGDDVYVLNMGDKSLAEKRSYSFSTDECDEFKFIAISNLRLGSKYQQLSIVNDIYTKGHEMGYNNVFVCGNISAGLYKLNNVYAETNFINDTNAQVEYIKDYYPSVEGMKTYFITGPVDDKHLSYNKINIGKRIAEVRDDMIYLGENSCDIIIDDIVMRIFCAKLKKSYTVSYPTQQQAFAFRSEDKPNVMLYAGLLQSDKYIYRDVNILSIPSVCATTKETEKYANTIGAWYVTIRTNKKGKLDGINALSSLYYKTNKDDYLHAKVLKINNKSKRLVKQEVHNG